MDDTQLEAAIFFESYLPDALARALEFAGNDGFVVSMPQLLHARAGAEYDNSIWNDCSFTSNSEESIATTAQGNHVVVVVHGGGIFATPERFRTLYHSSVDRNSELGFTGLFAAKISQQEARNVINGRFSDGSEIPVYSYTEIKQGVTDLPRRYAVILDFETAKNAVNGNVSFNDLKDDPLMITRAGGAEAAINYLNSAKGRGHSEVMGSWHNFREIDPNQPQTRVLFLGGQQAGAKLEVCRDLGSKERGYVGIWGTHYRVPIEAEYGIRGDTSMINMARYVAVAANSVSTSLRYLPFET